MKKWLCLIGIVTIGLMMAGCATGVYENHTAGKFDFLSRTWDYSSSDFTVLGPVEATAQSQVVLGLVAQGKEGYGLLMNAARQKYGNNVTTVMFIFSDYDYSGILYPIYGTITTKYSGVAVEAKTISQTPNVKIK